MVYSNQRTHRQGRGLCHPGERGLLCSKDPWIVHQCGGPAGDGGLEALEKYAWFQLGSGELKAQREISSKQYQGVRSKKGVRHEAKEGSEVKAQRKNK